MADARYRFFARVFAALVTLALSASPHAAQAWVVEGREAAMAHACAALIGVFNGVATLRSAR